MADSFFFYDLETSGISASRDRILQFAGQRTDLELKPVGEPYNLLVKLSPDILPAAEAILISGLSVNELRAKGIAEAEFTDIFNNQIATASTIFTGFNNLRFDDEFIRYTNYRNFYDPFSWHWRNQASRWDMLDVTRMTRALRPDGINWPFTDDGKPTNRLELLAAANNLDHAHAHDALSDSLATIDVARMLKSHQPKMFNYLLNLRSKTKLEQLLKSHDKLVYCSSHYSSDYLHTSVVAILSVDLKMSSALVYDLRVDASQFLGLSIDELADLWQYSPDGDKPRLPLKTMKLNRCPAVAPLSVLDDLSLERLRLNLSEIDRNYEIIKSHKTDFTKKLQQVVLKLDKQRDEKQKHAPRIPSVDERLYDGFLSNEDSRLCQTARDKAKLSEPYDIAFSNQRLNELYSLYRARNYPEVIASTEALAWHDFIKNKLFAAKNSQYEQYLGGLTALKKQTKDKTKLALLNELEAYAKSIQSVYGNG